MLPFMMVITPVTRLDFRQANLFLDHVLFPLGIHNPITLLKGWLCHSAAPFPQHAPCLLVLDHLMVLDHSKGGHKACSATSLPSQGHKEMLSDNKLAHVAPTRDGRTAQLSPIQSKKLALM